MQRKKQNNNRLQTKKTTPKNHTSFIPPHIRKTAAGFLAINKAYCWDKKETVEDTFDCDRHRFETFGLVSGFKSRYVPQNN